MMVVVEDQEAKQCYGGSQMIRYWSEYIIDQHDNSFNCMTIRPVMWAELWIFIRDFNKFIQLCVNIFHHIGAIYIAFFRKIGS